MIGIDCYMTNDLPGRGYYSSLGKCVRDKNYIKSFLASIEAPLGACPPGYEKLKEKAG